MDPVVRSILEFAIYEDSIQLVALVRHLENEWSSEAHCLVEYRSESSRPRSHHGSREHVLSIQVDWGS
jgi:hypothetical protein